MTEPSHENSERVTDAELDIYDAIINGQKPACGWKCGAASCNYFGDRPEGVRGDALSVTIWGNIPNAELGRAMMDMFGMTERTSGAAALWRTDDVGEVGVTPEPVSLDPEWVVESEMATDSYTCNVSIEPGAGSIEELGAAKKAALLVWRELEDALETKPPKSARARRMSSGRPDARGNG